MTLRQLEMFLAVAEAKSFTHGAQKLRLKQPTVSEQIHELEVELGTRLFDRSTHTVTVTEAGHVLQRHAARVLSILTDARRALDETKGIVRGKLAIGASMTPGIYVVPSVLAAFQEQHPGIDVSLHIGNSSTIQERVRSNTIDLGVIGGHVLRGRDPCVAAGVVDELFLVVPAHHRWATRHEVTPRDFSGTPLLMRELGSGSRMVTDRRLRGAGIKFTVALELDHIEALKQAVLAGLGVAFISLYAVRSEVATGRLHVLRVKGLRIVRHFHVIHNQTRPVTASGRAFVTLLERTRAMFGRNGTPLPLDEPLIASQD